LFDRFAKITDEVARSATPRYVLEVGLIELTRTEPLEPLGGLLDRLEALEGRLERHGARGALPPPQPTAATTPTAATKAAPPSPAAAPQPAGPRPAPQGFLQLVDAIIAIDPMLSGLAQSRLLSQDDRALSLGFDKEFAADGVRDRMTQLRAALKQLTGKELAVEIVVGPAATGGVAALPGTETRIEVDKRQVAAEREARRKEALALPARKVIEERFEGATFRDPVVDVDGEG
jgi:hypothetical protein